MFFAANAVSDRNITVETKVEVKNEFRPEAKPVITQQSTHVPASTGKWDMIAITEF